jgi:hypothetical protein
MCRLPALVVPERVPGIHVSLGRFALRRRTDARKKCNRCAITGDVEGKPQAVELPSGSRGKRWLVSALEIPAAHGFDVDRPTRARRSKAAGLP